MGLKVFYFQIRHFRNFKLSDLLLQLVIWGSQLSLFLCDFMFLLMSTKHILTKIALNIMPLRISCSTEATVFSGFLIFRFRWCKWNFSRTMLFSMVLIEGPKGKVNLCQIITSSWCCREVFAMFLYLALL